MKIQVGIGLRMLLGVPLALLTLYYLRGWSLEEIGAGTVMVVVLLSFSLVETIVQGTRAYLRSRQEKRTS